MQRTNIDWGIPNLHTWNPVVGCERGCYYCYARRINDRFGMIPDFSEPTFFPERLNEPKRRKKPTTIFVGSMSDIAYWKGQWVDEVIRVCLDCPQHTFMFLSKSPDAYRGYVWPENTRQGLTISAYHDLTNEDLVSRLVRFACRPWISYEPTLGPSRRIFPGEIERIVVGAMTGPGAIKCSRRDIESILVTAGKIPVYLKPSARAIMGGATDDREEQGRQTPR